MSECENYRNETCETGCKRVLAAEMCCNQLQADLEAAQRKEKELQIELGANDAAYRALQKELAIQATMIKAMAVELCIFRVSATKSIRTRSSEDIIVEYRKQAERE